MSTEQSYEPEPGTGTFHVEVEVGKRATQLRHPTEESETISYVITTDAIAFNERRAMDVFYALYPSIPRFNDNKIKRCKRVE